MLRNAYCILCLSVNRLTVNVNNANLQQLYEKLADFKIKDECWMCYICHTKLQQCHQLQQLAVQTRGLIDDVCQNKKLKEFKPIVELSLIKTQIISSTTPFLYADQSLETPHQSLDIPNQSLEIPNQMFETPNQSLEIPNQSLNIKSEPYVDDTNDDQHWNVPCVDPFLSTSDYIFDDQPKRESKPKLRAESVQSTHPVAEEYIVERHEDMTENTSVMQKIKFEFQDVGCNGMEQVKRRESEETNEGFSVPQTKKTSHKCEVCFKIFSAPHLLLQHAKTHAGKQQFTCDICSKTFSRKGVLKTHMLVHQGVKPFACEICQRKFSRVYHLNEHMRTHNIIKQHYSCHICSKELSCKRYLNIHIRKHLGDQHFSCHICFKDFVFKTSLSTHIKTHFQDKPFGCDVCPLKFKTKAGMKRHMETHGGDKPFSCDYCSWKFYRKADMIDHTRTHTGEKPFCCHYCKKEFSRKRNLRVHLRTHTGDKPYSCDNCLKQFIAIDSLKKHNCYKRM